MSMKPGRVTSGVPLGVDGGGRRAAPSPGARHGACTCCRAEDGGAEITRPRGGTSRPAGHPGGQVMPAITVTHNDVELALRLLKRQLQKSGLLRELRRRRQYEKPSERRRRRMREGIRNTRKRARLAHG
jgi:ribosomal protein S21